jgi:protein-S-isoprenylcysteine O-methyltransferase Ste14
MIIIWAVSYFPNGEIQTSYLYQFGRLYSITDNTVLRIMGSVLFVIGATGVIISYVNFFSAESGKLITKGLYQFSRNPI